MNNEHPAQGPNWYAELFAEEIATNATEMAAPSSGSASDSAEAPSTSEPEEPHKITFNPFEANDASPAATEPTPASDASTEQLNKTVEQRARLKGLRTFAATKLGKIVAGTIVASTAVVGYADHKAGQFQSDISSISVQYGLATDIGPRSELGTKSVEAAANEKMWDDIFDYAGVADLGAAGIGLGALRAPGRKERCERRQEAKRQNLPRSERRKARKDARFEKRGYIRVSGADNAKPDENKVVNNASTPKDNSSEA